MKPPPRALYLFIGRVGPIGWQVKRVWDAQQGGSHNIRLGDRDSRHRMDERRMRTASIGAHREACVNVMT